MQMATCLPVETTFAQWRVISDAEGLQQRQTDSGAQVLAPPAVALFTLSLLRVVAQGGF